jgi:CRP/FNR family transcriptional regulator, cyclic AMP receptor protein
MTTKSELGTSFTHNYPAGTMIFEENDPGSRMYVIRSGRVRIFRTVGTNEMVLALLGPGEFFGEMALLEGLPRSANAQASEDVSLIEVDAETFEQMIRTNSEIAVRMMRRLATRVRELDVRLQNVLVDSGLGRAIEVLRWLVPKGRRDGSFSRVSATAVHIGIAAQAGLPPSEINRVFDLLVQSGCIKEDGTDILISPLNVLDDFSNYIDLKRRYEPTDNQQDAAPNAEKEKEQSIRRLLKALQIEPNDLANHKESLSSQYKNYLALKRRFEASRGLRG